MSTMVSAAGARRRAIAGSVALAALLLCAGPAPGEAVAKRKPARRSAPALYWGAQIGDQLTGEKAPWDMGAVAKFARMAGKRPSLISFSVPFADCKSDPCSFYNFPLAPLEDVRGYGAVPFLNWSSEGSRGEADERDFRLAAVARGRYDRYVRYFAARAAAWGHPFFLRFDWEMNGFWFPWSESVNRNRPGQYVRAWRHVHRIFDAAGARNVTWVWCPNVDFTHRLTPMRGLYPGNRWVDWTCLDGFNWGATSNSAGWLSFGRVFGETYRRVARIAPHKPMVIGEVATDERGGSKAAWIRGMLRAVPSRYRRVRGLIWYEQRDQGMRWPLESSRRSVRAFRRGIRRPAYRPSLFGRISRSPIRPPR